MLYLYNLNFKIFRIKEENLKKIIKIVEWKIIILVFEGRCGLIIIRNYMYVWWVGLFMGYVFKYNYMRVKIKLKFSLFFKSMYNWCKWNLNVYIFLWN